MTRLEGPPKGGSEGFWEGEAFREALENSILLGIAAFDQEGHHVYVNPAFCKIVGWSKKDLIGTRPPYRYWPPEERDILSRAFLKIFSGEERSGRLESHLQRGSGERFDAFILFSTMRDRQGANIGSVISIGDITETKRREAEIRRLNLELEERVRQRTLELAKSNERLRQKIKEHMREEEARRRAELELEQQRLVSIRIDRLQSLGKMAAGIAHELNQPLTGIRGLAEYLLIATGRKWELSNAKLQEKLSLIVEQSDRMSHIIEHVRMFAREAGKYEHRPVQVNEVVQSSMAMLGEQFRAHGLALHFEPTEGLPVVQANPFSLEEVVLNLMMNARDATEERLKEEPLAPHNIELKTFLDARDPRRPVRIQVVDQGVGIPSETLPKIFDPFFTTKDPDKGTGLGLSICKSIVEEMGGGIDLHSTPGVGTTATVSLPADAPKED